MLSPRGKFYPIALSGFFCIPTKMKNLIMSDVMVQQMTDWFGPDKSNWKGKAIVIYAKNVKDADGKVLGQTLAIRRLTDPVDPDQWGIQ
jgi:hypothetical protein